MTDVWSNVDHLAGAEAVVVILERGYSEAFVQENIKRDPVLWGSKFKRWLDSDADLALIASTRPGSDGVSQFRSALVRMREHLPAAVKMVSDYLAGALPGGAKIVWLQGDTLSGETREMLTQALGSLPAAWRLQ